MTLAVSVVACAAQTGADIQARPDTFVDVASAVPGIVVEMRYGGSDNFVGRPIAGYETPACVLTREATAALAGVQRALEAQGRGLKVYDCYRPARAVAEFVAWAADPNDLAMKAEYYPSVEKDQLFELGYLAERSGHSRGSTVDLTMVDRATGAEIDMGSPWDLFDTRSWPTDATISPGARANRMALQAVMREHGFRSIRTEWWHFTLEGEAYPDTYFDFPLR